MNRKYRVGPMRYPKMGSKSEHQWIFLFVTYMCSKRCRKTLWGNQIQRLNLYDIGPITYFFLMCGLVSGLIMSETSGYPRLNVITLLTRFQACLSEWCFSATMSHYCALECVNSESLDSDLSVLILKVCNTESSHYWFRVQVVHPAVSSSLRSSPHHSKRSLKVAAKSPNM